MERARSIVFVCLGKWDSTLCLRAKCFGENLAQQGWRVEFLLPDIVENQSIQGYNVHLLPTRPLPFWIAGRRVLKRLHPEFVHFLNPEVKAVGLTVFNQEQKVVGDWEDWHAQSRDTGIRRYVTRAADKFMMRKSKIVLVSSKWLQSQFSAICDKKVSYIPYANLPLEMPSLPDPFDQPTFVWMGSFRSNMDYDLVLEAALELSRQNASINIQMVGHGPDWDKAKRFCEQNNLKNVSLPGFLEWDDMLNRLRWAHALLFPIRDNIHNNARCPFKVFQYAKAMRPIITNHVGEVPTFLGEQANYIECTKEAFAHSINELARMPRPEDIDFAIEEQTWADRSRDLIEALT